MLKLFNCNVRLGGNVLSDVPKSGVTEMEIRVLQAIHGDDAVILIKSAGETPRTDAEEASRLANEYNGKIVSSVSGIQSIAPLLIEGDDESETVVPTVETVETVVADPVPAPVTAKPGPKAKAAIE